MQLSKTLTQITNMLYNALEELNKLKFQRTGDNEDSIIILEKKIQTLTQWRIQEMKGLSND